MQGIASTQLRMSGAGDPTYPGESANAADICSLAEEYRLASECLWERRRRREPLSVAPFRLAATHAIELYLTAFLRHGGRTPKAVRGLHHDLIGRVELAEALGLRLRRRTVVNIARIARNREYLVVRYAPDQAADLSNPTQVIAALSDVRAKVIAAIMPPTPPET